MRILLLACVLVGCADIRIPLGYTGAQLEAVKRDVRTCGSISTLDREVSSTSFTRSSLRDNRAL